MNSSDQNADKKEKWANATSKPKGGAHHQSILRLGPHETLFLENDVAEALYIIKRGSIRLFKPKKEGQIELAVLHEGEVIGEMAFFDAGSRRRSCSAEALVTTELIEITFEQFDKVINGMSPWFKTIVNTLVDRLIHANATIKKFEDSSVSIGYGKGGGAGTYNFFKDDELVKFFAIYYLMAKEHQTENESILPGKLAGYYMEDIFSFSESKHMEFEGLLEDLEIADLQKDDNGKLEEVKIKDINLLKSSFVAFNKERHQASTGRMNLTKNCILLLDGIIKKHQEVAYPVNNPTVNIQTVMQELGKHNVNMDSSDLAAAVKHKLIEEPYMDAQNNYVCRVDLKKIEALLPLIKVNSALEKLNEEKRKKR